MGDGRGIGTRQSLFLRNEKLERLVAAVSAGQCLAPPLLVWLVASPFAACLGLASTELSRVVLVPAGGGQGRLPLLAKHTRASTFDGVGSGCLGPAHDHFLVTLPLSSRKNLRGIICIGVKKSITINWKLDTKNIDEANENVS
ncbi:hypothetical protein Ddc_05003 [Ditylenchus destructor]|nr:hypothetical protein Ddc_05003 [Ditylenchus destructor]